MPAPKDLQIEIQSVELLDSAPAVNISGRMEHKLSRTRNGQPWLELSLVSMGGTRMIRAVDIRTGKEALVPLSICIVYPEDK